MISSKEDDSFESFESKKPLASFPSRRGAAASAVRGRRASRLDEYERFARLPYPNADPYPSKPPNAARRPLVDGVRTRDRAVAGRPESPKERSRIAPPVPRPVEEKKTASENDSESSPAASGRTSTNGFGRFGFRPNTPPSPSPSPSPSRVARRSFARFPPPSSTSRSESDSNSNSDSDSNSVDARREGADVFVSSTRRRLGFASFSFSSRSSSSDETHVSRVSRVGLRLRRGGAGDGVARRYRTGDRVSGERTLRDASARLSRRGVRKAFFNSLWSIPSPPGPGSNAGRDAGRDTPELVAGRRRDAVSFLTRRFNVVAGPELVPGRVAEDHAGLPRAEGGGASVLRSTRRPFRSYSTTVRHRVPVGFAFERRLSGRASWSAGTVAGFFASTRPGRDFVFETDAEHIERRASRVASFAAAAPRRASRLGVCSASNPRDRETGLS